MTSLLHNNIRRLLLLRNLGNKCLAWKYVLGNNKLRGYPITEQSTYQSFLSRVQAVQSLHKFHQACDSFDEPRKKNTGKIEHYLPNQRVQRKKTHLRPRPHVSGYFWKRIFFFAVLAFCPHVNGRRFGRQKTGFRKRSPVRVEFLKTLSCRFLVDGRKRSFSNTTLSSIQHILCKRRYRTLFSSL